MIGRHFQLEDEEALADHDGDGVGLAVDLVSAGVRTAEVAPGGGANHGEVESVVGIEFRHGVLRVPPFSWSVVPLLPGRSTRGSDRFAVVRRAGRRLPRRRNTQAVVAAMNL